jgi:uncharacterized protein (DUF1330 family)
VAAYIIVNIEITDPERYVGYTQAVGPTLALYGGRFLVRGGKAEKLEGAIEPKRIVVLEFPSLERAKAWWNSPEYREPKALRQSTSVADLIVVEGV